MQAAQQAATQNLAAQQAQLPPAAEVPAAAAAAVAPAAAAAAAPEATPAAVDAAAPEAGTSVGAVAAGAAAGAAAGGMLGGMLRALSGRGTKDPEEKKAAAAKKAEEKAAREAEKQAAKEAEAAAAAAAKEAVAREAEAAAAAAAAHDAELTAAAAAAAAAIAASQGRASPSPVQSFTSTDMPSPVLVTPPGGGPPIPMLPLAVPPSDVQARMPTVCCAFRGLLGNGRVASTVCWCTHPPAAAPFGSPDLGATLTPLLCRTPTSRSSWACRQAWLQP